MGIVEEAHNVKVLGTGVQNLVLAHGFGTDQSVWKHLIPHVVDNYRVVLYDNMGAGTTNPEYFDFERYSTLEGHAYDLLAILEELQIESCIFVGHSVSAMIGAIASISRPDLFSKLVMISASPRYERRNSCDEARLIIKLVVNNKVLFFSIKLWFKQVNHLVIWIIWLFVYVVHLWYPVTPLKYWSKMIKYGVHIKNDLI